MESYRPKMSEVARVYSQTLELNPEDTDNVTEELLACALNLRASSAPTVSKLRASGVELDGINTANQLTAQLQFSKNAMSGELKFGWLNQQQSMYKYRQQGNFAYWDNGGSLLTSSDMLSHLASHIDGNPFQRLLDQTEIEDADLFLGLRDVTIPRAKDWELSSVYETADYNGIDTHGMPSKQSLARIVIRESLSQKNQPIVVLETVAWPKIGYTGLASAEDPTTDKALRFTISPGKPSHCELFAYSQDTNLQEVIDNSKQYNQNAAPVSLIRAVSLLDRNKYPAY